MCVGVVIVHLELRRMEQGGVVVGSGAHLGKIVRKSVSHGGAAAQHHDHDQGTEGERKKQESRKEQELVAAARGSHWERVSGGRRQGLPAGGGGR